MNNDSLVAINLTIGKKLINPTLLPILYYWNGTEDLEKTLTNDNEVLSIIKNACKTYDDYEGAKISYFLYNTTTENYDETTIRCEDIFNIDILNDSVWVNSVQEIFDGLYKAAFDAEYDGDVTGTDRFIDIYNKIIEKYNDKLNPLTFINYIRSKLGKQRTIKYENKEYIINKVNELLNI